MSYQKEIGRIGEQLVADWLKTNGYIITKRNFSCGYGEIDIVAERPKMVVFVEVKTRKQNSLVAPKDAVSKSKQEKLAKTAKTFLNRAYMKNMPYRFDVAEVTYRIGEDELPKYSLNYIKNAFFKDLSED
ncbi:MAG: YraN family protein [Clostridia bacterium]|nr:YraN family protein [Clostridia bacterium]